MYVGRRLTEKICSELWQATTEMRTQKAHPVQAEWGPQPRDRGVV